MIWSFSLHSLLEKIENYKKVAKFWGVETYHSVLKMIFSHKNIGTTAGFATALPSASLSSSVIAGFSTSLGQIGVELLRIKHQKTQEIQGDSVRFLIELNKLAGEEDKD